MSPGAAAAAAVAAVAQGLRQQMCSMVAAAHNQSTAHETNPVASLVNSLALAGHCGNMSMPPSNGAPPMSMSHIASMRSMSSPAGELIVRFSNVHRHFRIPQVTYSGFSQIDWQNFQGTSLQKRKKVGKSTSSDRYSCD